MFDTPTRAGNRSWPGRSKLTNQFSTLYCQIIAALHPITPAPRHGTEPWRVLAAGLWDGRTGEGEGKQKKCTMQSRNPESWKRWLKRLEFSPSFSMNIKAFVKVKFLCLFLKFPATHQLEGLVPEVRKVLPLRLVMSSCFNHLEKENRKTLLSDPLTGLQRSWGAMRWHEMSWDDNVELKGHSDTSTEVRVIWRFKLLAVSK